MPLASGSRIGPYQIVAPIGAGGMGEVYRARDSRLGRDVAVKVLPQAFASNPERVRRFEQEARAASALNHPNILVIHDVGDEGGVFYVVSELLEGETLRQRIKEGPIPVRKAVDYAAQIARGLAAAHARAIVHRDIKPDNLFITRDGRVKILDFGLAKTGAPSAESDRTETQVTQAGVVLGTAGYMSPEQVRGREVDHRADIFSFGIVLHEMLSGQKTFTGESFVEVMNAILKEEARELPDTLPPLLRQVVMRCLEKQPDERFESIRDVAYTLESISGTSEKAVPLPSAPRQKPARMGWIVAALALVALTFAISWWWFGRPRPPGGLKNLTKLTRESGLTTDPAISLDGKLVAYASDRSGENNLDIYVQQIGGGEPIRLTAHQADDTEPSFSPDGTKVVFRSERDGGGIFIAPSLGGEARRLTRQGRLPRFSPDGNWISYYEGMISGDTLVSRTYVIGAAGGKPRQLQPNLQSASFPAWAPDGKHLVFRGRKPGTTPSWWITTLDGEAGDLGVPEHEADSTLPGAPVFSADGKWLIYTSGSREQQNLWRVRISQSPPRIVGKPERLTFGTAVERQAAVSAGTRMVFNATHLSVNLFSLPVDANRGAVTGELRQLTQDDAVKFYPALSGDGKRLVYRSNRSGYEAIWIKDLGSGKESPLTASSTILAGTAYMVMSRDGAKVAFAAYEGPHRVLMSIPTDGGVAEKIGESAGNIWDWSPDGKTLLVARGQAKLESFDIATGQHSLLAKQPKTGVYNFYFSPDGRWIAFETRNKPDCNRLHIIPFRQGTEVPESEWITVTDGSFWDDKPRWSPDGNLLYFVSYRDGFLCIWAVRLDPSTRHPAGQPFPVYHSHGERRSLMNYGLGPLFVPVAADKLVFPLGERGGNIWLAEFAAE